MTSTTPPTSAEANRLICIEFLRGASPQQVSLGAEKPPCLFQLGCIQDKICAFNLYYDCRSKQDRRQVGSRRLVVEPHGHERRRLHHAKAVGQAPAE
jgi:hypothetical protein